jgi:hypothetical protein
MNTGPLGYQEGGELPWWWGSESETALVTELEAVPTLEVVSLVVDLHG